MAKTRIAEALSATLRVDNGADTERKYAVTADLVLDRGKVTRVINGTAVPVEDGGQLSFNSTAGQFATTFYDVPDLAGQVAALTAAQEFVAEATAAAEEALSVITQ